MQEPRSITLYSVSGGSGPRHVVLDLWIRPVIWRPKTCPRQPNSPLPGSHESGGKKSRAKHRPISPLDRVPDTISVSAKDSLLLRSWNEEVSQAGVRAVSLCDL